MDGPVSYEDAVEIATVYAHKLLPVLDEERKRDPTLQSVWKVKMRKRSSRGKILWELEIEDAKPTEDGLMLIGEARRIK